MLGTRPGSVRTCYVESGGDGVWVGVRSPGVQTDLWRPCTEAESSGQERGGEAKAGGPVCLVAPSGCFYVSAFLVSLEFHSIIQI